MAGYQPGDGYLEINGRVYALRLTMGALAEAAQRMSALGPAGMAQAMRDLTSGSARTLLACLLRPDLPRDQDADRLAASLPDAEISEAIMRVSEVLQEQLNAQR